MRDTVTIGGGFHDKDWPEKTVITRSDNMKTPPVLSLSGQILGLGLLLLCQAVQAQLIETRLGKNTVLVADIRPGKSTLPAVILLHGFLQTRHFQTVERLQDGLATSGFTTLAPTLSLGISRRSKSMACEAAHRHTLEQDVKEIALWVNWLAQRQPGPIVLIGHSYGSLEGLVYAADHPHPALSRIIALSLVDTEQPTSHSTRLTVPAMLNDATTRRARGNNALVDFAIGHCKKFTATPQSYLSYANWDRKKVLDLSRRTRVPLNVILGGADNRMGADWAQALTAAGVRVDKINGANHFFDAEYEFDLLDLVINHLKSPIN